MLVTRTEDSLKAKAWMPQNIKASNIHLTSQIPTDFSHW